MLFGVAFTWWLCCDCWSWVEADVSYRFRSVFPNVFDAVGIRVDGQDDGGVDGNTFSFAHK